MSEPWPWKVYVITCVPTGQQYVGITSTPIDLRAAQHILAAYRPNGKRGNPQIHQAIREHGWNAFSMEQNLSCRSKKDAEDYEALFIGLLKTRSPTGFNLTDGGPGNRGAIVSAEARAKHSANGTAWWNSLSPERQQAHRARLHAMHTNPDFRRIKSQATKAAWARRSQQERQVWIDRAAAARAHRHQSRTIRDPRQSDLPW